MTLVELLIVIVIITVMAVSIGRMIGAALALEQRYRAESDVMESLADNLAYAERYFSLASTVANQTAAFRMEAGGVSFETNHWMRVRSVTAFSNNLNFACNILSDDPSRPTNAVREFSTDGKQRIARATVTEVKVDGSDPMRRIRIVATGMAGTNIYTAVAERPVRLWNQ